MTANTDRYCIRPGQPEDIPAIVELSEQWAAEASTIGQVAATAEIVKSWLGGCLWVTDHVGVTVGFAYASVQSEEVAVVPNGDRYLKLEELYVRPDHRDHGIGRQLVERIFAEAASQGITHGWVYSSAKEWQRIVSLYERLGFKMWFVGLYR